MWSIGYINLLFFSKIYQLSVKLWDSIWTLRGFWFLIWWLEVIRRSDKRKIGGTQRDRNRENDLSVNGKIGLEGRSKQNRAFCWKVLEFWNARVFFGFMVVIKQWLIRYKESLEFSMFQLSLIKNWSWLKILTVFYSILHLKTWAASQNDNVKRVGIWVRAISIEALVMTLWLVRAAR